MGVEIERKFLVISDAWRAHADAGTQMAQGYLCSDPQRVVRVRLAGERATLTIKGLTLGACRSEFEYPLPLEDARQLLEELCLRPLIEKIRHEVPFAGLVWEVDVFRGDNQGLIVAEVELATAEQSLELPSWVGNEVTGDFRYSNASLIHHPYRCWGARAEEAD